MNEIPADKFEDFMAEHVEEDEPLAYMLFSKDELDALVRILRRAEQGPRQHPQVQAHVSALLDQAQSVQANYERQLGE